MGLIDNVNVNVGSNGNILDTLSTYVTKILKPNIIDGKNVLVQEMMNVANTKYVIKYDYGLNGETITIPEGCLLEFDGGSLNNGELIGQNTGIEAGLVKIFDTDITISGTWGITEIYPEWFGAVANMVVDCSDAITKCFEWNASMEADYSVCVIKLSNGKYMIDKPIIIPSVKVNVHWFNVNSHSITIKGESQYGSILIAGNNNNRALFAPETLDYPSSNRHYLNLQIDDVTLCGNYLAKTSFEDFEYIQVYRFNMTHVIITEFSEIGITIKRVVGTSQNTECNWREVRCCYNWIGMTYDGASCSFYGCRWERNRYQGLLINRAGAATAFFECLFQYNVNVHQEVINHFGELGDTPGNLVINSEKGLTLGFYSCYFEPSFDTVEANPNYAPITYIVNEDYDKERLAKISLYSCYVNMFYELIYIKGTTERYKIEGLKIYGLTPITNNHAAYLIGVEDENKNLDIDNAYIDAVDVYNSSDISSEYVIKPAYKSKVAYIGTSEVKIKRFGDSSSYPTDVLKPQGFMYFDLAKRIPTFNLSGKIQDAFSYTAHIVHGNKSDTPSMSLFDTNDYGAEFYSRDIKQPNWLWINPSGYKRWLNAIGRTPNILYGATNNRPTDLIKLTDEGYLYFDTDLQKPIWAAYFPVETNDFVRKWVEADGAKAGVLRNGATTDRPVGNDIYVGFMYFDTTLGKPIYASAISDNTVTWVDATGATV